MDSPTQALIDEFQRRGIDVSAVYNGKAISLARPIRYDQYQNKLTFINFFFFFFLYPPLRTESVSSPYGLNGGELPAVRPRAGKCQADSGEENEG
jgi:hypothetical protein